MFFRYGEQMRWTKPGIADAVRGPRVYQHEQLPLGPSWADVQRLLASTETNHKADIRDRPILLLLAVYGLRVGEVQRLRLLPICQKLNRVERLVLRNAVVARNLWNSVS